jgi:hypothetical protein
LHPLRTEALESSLPPARIRLHSDASTRATGTARCRGDFIIISKGHAIAFDLPDPGALSTLRKVFTDQSLAPFQSDPTLEVDSRARKNPDRRARRGTTLNNSKRRDRPMPAAVRHLHIGARTHVPGIGIRVVWARRLCGDC